MVYGRLSFVEISIVSQRANTSMKNFIKRKSPFLLKAKRSLEDQTALFNAQLSEIYKNRQLRHPNLLCRYGKRIFCQSDEDGLTIEILRRLNVDKGSFIELGVGNGTENNTLALLSLGFKGAWIGGEELAFKISPQCQRLSYQKAWITLENIENLYKNALTSIGVENPDVLSIDLDGNDYYFMKKVLSLKSRPKLIICEINGIFPPPIEFTVEYSADHVWERDDYQGCSLSLMEKLLVTYGYKLIVCNAATGVNAFFVSEEFFGLFPETPDNINDIYVEPLHINYTGFSFPRSLRTIERIIEDVE